MAKRIAKLSKGTSEENPTENDTLRDTEKMSQELAGIVGAMQAFRWLGLALGNQPLTAIIGILGAISFVGSIAYAVGYLFILDPMLISLFSLQDVIATALPAIPGVSLVIALASIFATYFTKLGNERAPLIIQESGTSVRKDDPRTGQIRRILSRAILGLLISGFLIFFVHRFMALLLVALIILSFILGQFAKRDRILAAGFVMCTMFLTLIMGMFFVFGATSADTYLGRSTKYYLIEADNRIYDGMLLAATGDFLIVRDDARTVKLIPRRSIKEIKVLKVFERGPWLKVRRAWNYLFPIEPYFNVHGR